MAFVVDASVALCWLFQTQATAFTTAVLDRALSEDVWAPDLFALEISNTLARGHRRGLISGDEIERFLDLLLELPVRQSRCEPHEALSSVYRIAFDHGLTAYDAVYIDLARRLDLPIASSNEQLLAAAAELGVARFEP